MTELGYVDLLSKHGINFSVTFQQELQWRAMLEIPDLGAVLL